MVLSLDIIPIPTDEAVREVEKRVLGVETNITNWQRRQNTNNNFSAVIPYDMELQRKESKEFLDDLTTRDQRMMFAVMTIVLTGDTKELSKRKCPCDKCVYTFGDLCLFPHSDGFIEDLEIDPCYEGVLRFLVKDIGVTADSGVVAELRSVVTELRDELDREHNAFIAVCKAAVTCAELVFSYSRCAPDMRESIIESADRIRDIVQELAYEAITRKERNEVNSHNETEAKTL